MSTGISELLYESIKPAAVESDNNLDDDLVNAWATGLADDGLWGSNAPAMNRVRTDLFFFPEEKKIPIKCYQCLKNI